MAPNETASPEATEDLADTFASFASPEEDEPEEETTPEAPSEESSDDEEAKDPEPEDEEELPPLDGDSPDEQGGDEPPLSERIKPDEEWAKSNPDLAKRFAEQVKGLEKKERQLAAEAEERTQRDQTLTQFLELEQRLSNPETAAETLQRIVAAVTAQHNLDPADFIEVAASDNSAVKALEAKIARLEAQLDTDRKTRATSEQRKTWVETVAPKVVAQAKAKYGMELTPQQALKAAEEYPKLNPLDAVKRAYPDEYAQAFAKRSQRPSVPNMVATTGRKESIQGEPDDVFVEVYKNINGV